MYKKILFILLLMMSLLPFANAIEFKPYVGIDAGYVKYKIRKLNKSLENENSLDFSDNIAPFFADNIAISNTFEYYKNDFTFNYSLIFGLKSYFTDKFYTNISTYYRTGTVVDESHYLGIMFNQFVVENRDEVKLKNNYGVKISVGYDFTERFGGFFSYGINHFNYNFKSILLSPINDLWIDVAYNYNPSIILLDLPTAYKASYSKTKLNNSFDIGLNYKLTKNIEFTFIYEYMFIKNYIFSNKFINSNTSIRKKVIKFNNLQAYRIGMNYLF